MNPARSTTLVAVFSGCVASEPEVDDECLGTIASDPAFAATSGWCFGNYSWNGTKARIYHPSNGGCSQSVYSPLVILLHAKGTMDPYDHTEYHYLQRHLARNGFISVSVEVADQDPDDAAITALDFVDDFVLSHWKKRVYIDHSSVGLVGHSRGGAAMRFLAQTLESHPTLQVKSVVALAPASQGPFLKGGQTIGYLHIYGTNDGDTSPADTYRHYDRSGDDGPQLDPVWNGDVLYKAVKLMVGASHRGYSDKGAAVQNDAVKGYVLAFLAAHNKRDATWYEGYIRGCEVPGGRADPVYTSYSDGFYRRVIDNFDDGSVANSTIGGVTATSLATAQVIDAPFPHSTKALWMWGQSTNGLVTWTIPEGKRNASAFEWLSVRGAQLSGAPANDLRIQIRNGVTWSPEVRLTDHGLMPQPIGMCYAMQGGGCLPSDLQVESHLATIRVPLSAFGPHDDVQNVRFLFRGDSVPDAFLVDNLEFSEWELKP